MFSESTSHRQDLVEPNWKLDMESEFASLRNNNTWFLVPCPPDINVVTCRWVFKLKQHPNGSIDRHKAHFVSRGFTHQYVVDYQDTFSHVVIPAMVRLNLFITISRGWHIRQIDVNNAFLHDILNEHVYIR